MDVQGKVVKAIHLKGNVGEQQRFNLGLNELSSGMYVLHIKNGENSITKRFAVE
jgi:ethanolamine utilization microcompartment shell protein EutS